MIDKKKFKGHTIIKKGNITIIRDDIEDIVIKGKLIDIISRKSTMKKKTTRTRPLILR